MNSLRFACLALGLVAAAPACEASVVISGKATANMSCSQGVCSPTSSKAVLNVGDLTNMLAAGDLKITTGSGAVTITVSAPFSWTSTNRPTLDAYYNVSFRAPVTVAGQGAVTITYNDGGSGGDLLFFPGAKLDFWDTRSSLIINGDSYKLSKNLNDLRHKIAADPSGSYALREDQNESRHGPYRRPLFQVPFAGKFEGLGHSTRNLTIQQYKGAVGMFSQPLVRARFCAT